jgi:hypothetical protein
MELKRATPFEGPKVTKMAVSRDASLRSRPLPRKTDKTWAGIILPLPSLALPQKLPMPCHRTALHRFVGFRPKLLC